MTKFPKGAACRRGATVSVVTLCLLVFMGTPVAEASSRALPGMGSTLTAWKHVYGVSSGPGNLCKAKNSCFGRVVQNSDSGRDYQFSNVFVDGGIIDGYQENFPNHTSLATVESEIARTLPSDSTFGPVIVDTTNGSCGLITVTGPTLAKIFGGSPKYVDPSGSVSINVSYINANFDSVYSAKNIQSAQVLTLANDPTQSC